VNGPAGRRRAVTAVLVTTVLVALAGLALTGLCWDRLATSDAVANAGDAAGAIAYAALGALIVYRTSNLTGWFMLAGGIGSAVMAAGSGYAIFGLAVQPGAVPAPAVVGALAESAFAVVITNLAAMFVVFPTGRLPSPRWRPVAWAGLGLVGLTLAAFVVSTRQVALPAPGGISLTYPNPLAVRSLGPAARLVTLNRVGALFLVLLIPALVSLAIRYRRGDQRLRQQMKWLGLAIAGVLACQVVALLAKAAGQQDTVLTAAPDAITPLLVLLGIPVAMAIAILRYRLFDINVIISRALLVTLLSAGVTAVYAAIVLGIGTLVGSGSDPLLTVAAAVVIALVFQPLRQRASRLANRLVYGERATPYQVLSDFAAGMAGQLDLGGALDRMVSLLGGAAGASRVEAWVRVGGELRPAAVWPGGSAPSAAVELNGAAELPAPGVAARMVPVRHGEDLLGAISLAKPPSEALTSTEDGLLRHLASQAGLVMRNAQLTAELRATIEELLASRRRLVGAQDAERRRIERNLHDGAQQQLIALSIHLGLLAESAGDPDQVRAAIPDLKAQLAAALEDLRALARGIYPPLLADRGLVVALRAQAARSPVPAVVEAGQVGRYPQDAESTVYFCALEALQNVAKHARATAVTIRLAQTGGALEFSVTDDGAGFPAAAARHGSGLQGMSDRLAAHGGTLTVRSEPGQGTTITGRLATSERPAAAGLRPEPENFRPRSETFLARGRDS
jgi:signal transduction histidine kinase